MIVKKENLGIYKVKNEKKKVNVLSIDDAIKDMVVDNNKCKISDLFFDIEKYQTNETNIKALKEYFQNYEFYMSKGIYIIRDNKEVIIVRNAKEREFFFNSHLKFFMEKRNENEKLIDFENRLDEILIYKKYVIFDYLKYDYEITNNQ